MFHLLTVGLAMVCGPAFAGEIAVPDQPKVYAAPVPAVPRAAPPNYDQTHQTMLEILQNLMHGPIPADMDVEEINRAYNEGRKNSTGSDKYDPVQGDSFFSKAAQECGEAKQKECSPSNFGGRTMCGLAVAKMISCMAPVIGGGQGCSGGCGNGKDYVDCVSGQMRKCGYTKLDARDSRCKMAGAVLSYAQSPTARGQVYGHVEFVCGNNRFCSVYHEPHDRPWPRYPADACWYPASQVAKGGT